MKTILITGMSATGKSTVIADLLALGFNAADLDNDTYSMWVDAVADPAYPDNEVKPGKDWIWNEAPILALLASCKSETLFLSGCASNMGRFYPYFDHIVLLTAPDNVMLKRLGSRNGNAYGQSDEEAARVLRLKETIEPLLRSDADLEIDTSIPGQSTVNLILQHAGVKM